MKKLLCIFLLMLTVISFASCHEKKDRAVFEVPTEFDTEKQYEITFWAKNDTNIVQAEIYDRTIAEFENLYPNIKVTLRDFTDYGMIYNDVITNIATDTTPNVCITYPDHIATYLEGDDVVVPLDSLMADEKYGLGGSELRFDSPTREELVEKYLDECVIDGSYYAMPFVRSTEVCYVNKTYVEKLGYTLPDVLTWDFVFEVSSAAMEKDENGYFKVNGQKKLIPFIYKSTDNMMIQRLYQMGADYSTEDGKILIFNDTTKEFLLSLVPYADERSFSTFKIDSYPANSLNRGQCIFAIDSTAGSTWMGSDAPLSDIGNDTAEFETAVMMIPQCDTESPKMISQGPSVCIFNKDDPGEVLASWLFVQFLLTNDVQIAYSTTEGYSPVTKKAIESAEYTDYLSRGGEDTDHHYYVKIAATKLLIENTDNTFVTPVFNGSASLRNAAGQMIENVVKSTRRGQTVDDAYIDALYEEMVSLYHLEEEELGPLPSGAKWLIGTLAFAWVAIIAYTVFDKLKKRKK